MKTNDDLLFEAPIQLSPRLAWLRLHKLVTERTDAKELGGCTWVCRTITPPLFGMWTPRSIGGGDTEDEAIVDFAKAAGIRLWNEEAR